MCTLFSKSSEMCSGPLRLRNKHELAFWHLAGYSCSLAVYLRWNTDDLETWFETKISMTKNQGRISETKDPQSFDSGFLLTSGLSKIIQGQRQAASPSLHIPHNWVSSAYELWKSTLRRPRKRATRRLKRVWNEDRMLLLHHCKCLRHKQKTTKMNQIFYPIHWKSPQQY